MYTPLTFFILLLSALDGSRTPHLKAKAEREGLIISIEAYQGAGGKMVMEWEVTNTNEVAVGYDYRIDCFKDDSLIYTDDGNPFCYRAGDVRKWRETPSDFYYSIPASFDSIAVSISNVQKWASKRCPRVNF